MAVIPIVVGAELPDCVFTWRDSAGALIQFGTIPHTFSFRIATPTPFIKTTGITGADTDPNVTVTFTAGELDTLATGIHRGELWARRTSDSKDRNPLPFSVKVTAAIPIA